MSDKVMRNIIQIKIDTEMIRVLRRDQEFKAEPTLHFDSKGIVKHLGIPQGENTFHRSLNVFDGAHDSEHCLNLLLFYVFGQTQTGWIDYLLPPKLQIQVSPRLDEKLKCFSRLIFRAALGNLRMVRFHSIDVFVK